MAPSLLVKNIEIVGHIIYLIAYLGELFTHSINGLLV